MKRTKTKLLCALLTLCMVLALLPTVVFAEGEEIIASVKITLPEPLDGVVPGADLTVPDNANYTATLKGWHYNVRYTASSEYATVFYNGSFDSKGCEHTDHAITGGATASINKDDDDPYDLYNDMIYAVITITPDTGYSLATEYEIKHNGEEDYVINTAPTAATIAVVYEVQPTAEIVFKLEPSTHTIGMKRVPRGRTYTLPTLGAETYPTGKEFGGWLYQTRNDDGTTSGKIPAPQAYRIMIPLNVSNIIAYAQWKNAPVTITYNSNGGSPAQQTVTVTAHEAATLLEADSFTPPTGKAFSHWAIGGTGVDDPKRSAGDSYTFTKNTTVYAVWEAGPPPRYTITYDYNGGAVDDATSFKKTATEGIPSVIAQLPSNCIGPEGKIFDGWAIGSASSTEKVQPGVAHTFTGATRLYAIWKKATIINRIVVNGVTAPAVGNKPDVEISVPDEAPYTLSMTSDPNKRWYYTFKSAEVALSDTFAPDESYSIDFTFSPKPGYVFADKEDIDVVIDGIDSDRYMLYIGTSGSENGRLVWLDFPALAANTYLVRAYPGTVNNGTSSMANCVKGSTVTIKADSPAANMRFKEWQGADGLTFTEGTSAASSTAKFTMPARNVELKAVYEKDEEYVEIINRIVVNGMTAPAIGERPDVSISVPDEAPYTLSMTSNPDELWYYTFENDEVALSDTFAANESYSIQFTFSPKSGYVFADKEDIDVVINGIDSDRYMLYIWPVSNPNNRLVGLDFPALAANTYLVRAYPGTVNNGTSSMANCVKGNTVTIKANPPETNMRFKEWQGADGLTFTEGTSAASSTAKFTMPARNVRLTAVYEKDATSISIATSGYKTAYKVGEVLNTAGLKIWADYTDGTDELVSVTPDMITGFDSSAAVASQTLTIKFGGKTATYNISVVDALLEFVYKPTFNIPAGTVGTAIAAIEVRSGVSGGKPNYTFSKEDGPDWLSVSDTGSITGTRPASAMAATTAVIRVTDSAPGTPATKEITIQVGAVNAAGGTGTGSGSGGGGSASTKHEVTDAGAYVFPFTDVHESDWYYASVRDAHKMGLINGRTATLYKPADYMTVAEAVKLAACMRQLYAEGKVTLTNGSPDWYSPYYDYCRANGIVIVEYTEAQMNTNITREQYADIFSRALPDEALAEKNIIPDGSIPDVQGSEYYNAIYKLYRAGIVNGVNAQGAFQPESNIQRSEVAAILIRMMNPSVRVGAPSELGK